MKMMIILCILVIFVATDVEKNSNEWRKDDDDEENELIHECKRENAEMNQTQAKVERKREEMLQLFVSKEGAEFSTLEERKPVKDLYNVL